MPLQRAQNQAQATISKANHDLIGYGEDYLESEEEDRSNSAIQTEVELDECTNYNSKNLIDWRAIWGLIMTNVSMKLTKEQY